jgi:hypothetical protein
MVAIIIAPQIAGYVNVSTGSKKVRVDLHWREHRLGGFMALNENAAFRLQVRFAGKFPRF